MIKRVVILVLLSTLIIGSFFSYEDVQSASTEKVKILVNKLNVRSGPGLDYQIIDSVHVGETYSVIEEQNDWFKIKIAQSEGWVAGWYVEKLKQVSSITKTAEATVDNLNVRTGPSTSFNVIEQIHPEKKYPILDIQGEWIKIQLNSDKSGWVASWFVKISDNIPSDDTQQSDLVTIEADILNVRSEPSTDSNIIGKLKNGEKVEVVAIQEGWYKIKYSNGFGWIASKYATEVQTDGNQDNQQQNPSAESKQVIVNADILNLRKGPSTKNEVIGKFKKGNLLTVHDSNGDWIYVSKSDSPNIKGWVANWFVTDYNKIVSNQPTVSILYSGTNLRQGPSTSYPIIGRANAGEKFPIISTEGDWYQIQLSDGSKAFVAGWIVSAKGVEQNISRGIENLLTGKVIVIDAGHGGRDQGATGFHFKSIEKNLNLEVAKLLQKKLESAGATVIMTRNNDIKIPLQERVDIAAVNKADAFISIHHNTNSNTLLNGTITYYHDSSDKILAKEVQNELTKKIGTDDLGARYGEYFVLRENNQVAILIELAFISNYHDELKANSDKFQENAAEGIFQGILKYFNK